MGGGLKGTNHDKRKYDTRMNICKGPNSLEEAWKPTTVSRVESDNDVSEFNNEILTETDEHDDGSVKPSSPSGKRVLM